MKLSSDDLGDLAEVAILAATEAGQMIAQSRPQDVQHKDTGHSLASQVVTEIDRASEDSILETIKPTLERFELGLLTEEQTDDGGRAFADYFWCIDPLDGTLSFIEGTPGYSVSIALVRQDGVPQIGVVYDPVTETLFHSVAGAGVFRNRSSWPTQSQAGGDELSVFIDRSFLSADDYDARVFALERIARDAGLAGIRIHDPRGAVMNACGVLSNAPACYFKSPKPSGGLSLWDVAATASVFQEAGAIATDIHGNALELNRADSTFVNHRGILFATDEALAAKIRVI